MTRTLQPSRARIAPAVRPPRPAPTTTTSYCAIQPQSPATQCPENPLISAVLAARARDVKCAGCMAQVRHGAVRMIPAHRSCVVAVRTKPISHAVLRRLLLDRGLHRFGPERYGA